jgi:hypothetical protein
MRSIISLFIAISILLLPSQSFAQTQSSNHPGSSQQGEKCSEENVLVRIKLKNREKLEGGLLEKTSNDVKVCQKGNTRLIATNDIRELKTKMTGAQRFRHTLRILGVACGATILFGLILYSASRT